MTKTKKQNQFRKNNRTQKKLEKIVENKQINLEKIVGNKINLEKVKEED